MPVFNFKGKSIIHSHHLGVPFRELIIDQKKSLASKNQNGKKQKPSLDDNLIIHGDNLHALKALLPRYDARVKCIYIDPPYNTGNEGWKYSDNVNSIVLQRWLQQNDVAKDDLERHEKWLCMMWPRLQLLKELLAEDGVIFVSVDDNEQHHLRMVMDEIFQERNFLALISWQGMDTIKNDVKFFSSNTEYILCYAKNINKAEIKGFERTGKQKQIYKNQDKDPRGPYLLTPLHAKSGTENNLYKIRLPNDQIWEPPAGRYPLYSKEKLEALLREDRIWLDLKGKKVPQKKTYLSEVDTRTRPHTFWPYEKFGSTRQANAELREILGRGKFENPKPSQLIRVLLDLVTEENSIVLDSFAGSGTTAQAVLDLNKEDGGDRKFILVECENYADKITAERVRRVIKGVPKARDDKLKKGLGGSFTYCTLGDEISTENLLKAKNLPSYEQLAKYVYYTATGKSLKKVSSVNKEWFIGEASGYNLHLIYKPDKNFLKGKESALNFDVAEKIKKFNKKNKKTIVFASHHSFTQKELKKDYNINFCQLPYDIHRIVGT